MVGAHLRAHGFSVLSAALIASIFFFSPPDCSRWMVMVTGAENTVFANEEYVLRFSFPADVRWDDGHTCSEWHAEARRWAGCVPMIWV